MSENDSPEQGTAANPVPEAEEELLAGATPPRERPSTAGRDLTSEETGPATTPSPPSPSPLSRLPRQAWRLEDLLKTRRTYAVTALLIVLITVFSSGSNRHKAINFIEKDLRPPVREVAPLKIYDAYHDYIRDCPPSSSIFDAPCPSPSVIDLFLRTPGALFSVLKHVVSQGVAGVILIGLSALFIAGLVMKMLRDGEDVPLWHPSFWALSVLAVAVIGWLMQLGVLAALLVVKQTIVACGTLALFYLVYEKYELYNKMTDVIEGMMTGKRA